jgi:predicted Zn-dependent protease
MAFFMLAFSSGLLWVGGAQAQGGQAVIRDWEIEQMLRQWMDPVFQAAQINSKNVKIIIVQSHEMNAFVAGGSNIFIYTGLMEKTETPGELIGVLAHEMGHITGGHLIRARDAMERASYESIIGTLLGVGAALVTGDAGAVPSVSLGAGSMARRRLLAHSRVQEASADQAALSLLEGAKINPTGLASFMEKLKSEIYMPTDQQSEYVLTHPLVENRIDAIKTRLSKSAYKDKPYPPEWVEQHARMKAKLMGFIHPERIAWAYNDRDQSIAARYARVVAAYQNNQVDFALKQMDVLLAKEPNNPHFLELKGQMLLEFGRKEKALAPYSQAVELQPEAALFRIGYGHALIESAAGMKEADARYRQAIEQLERALQVETRSSLIHRLLATAYGRLGQEDLAKVHLAEEAILQRRLDYARQQAEVVLNRAPEKSKAWLKAKDVLTFLDSHEKG